MAEKKQESIFSARELMQKAKSLSVKPEVMAGAIKLAGKNKLTKAAAMAAVKEFRKREV